MLPRDGEAEVDTGNHAEQDRRKSKRHFRRQEEMGISEAMPTAMPVPTGRRAKIEPLIPLSKCTSTTMSADVPQRTFRIHGARISCSTRFHLSRYSEMSHPLRDLAGGKCTIRTRLST